jgi:hypothetical protein
MTGMGDREKTLGYLYSYDPVRALAQCWFGFSLIIEKMANVRWRFPILSFVYMFLMNRDGGFAPSPIHWCNVLGEGRPNRLCHHLENHKVQHPDTCLV